MGDTQFAYLLGKEIMDRSGRAQFVPAVYKHQHVGVLLTGTVPFSIAAGKPHLRIFLNQEESDLKQGRDLIAPNLLLLPAIRNTRAFTILAM